MTEAVANLTLSEEMILSENLWRSRRYPHPQQQKNKPRVGEADTRL